MHRPLLTLLALAAAVSAPADPGAPEPWCGTWVRVDTERDDAARNVVIERATESIPFVARGLARAVMRRRMRPTDRYVIERNGDLTTILSDRGEAFPLDGRPHGGAEADSVTSRLESWGILQSWRHGEESHGVTRWLLHPSGERVVVVEQVNDPHFAGPIEFSTTYSRIVAAD